MMIDWQQTSSSTWRGWHNGYEVAGIDQWDDGWTSWLCFEIPEISYFWESHSEPCVDLEDGQRVAAELFDEWLRDGRSDEDKHLRRARSALDVG